MDDLAGLDLCFLAGTLGPGGAERQLYYILQALRAEGARPRLLSLTQNEFWEAPIAALGVPIAWVGANGAPLARLGRIVSALRRNPPAILQSAHFYTNLYAAAAARLLGAREIGALRSDVFSEVNAHAFAGKISLRMPRILAANSHAAIANARSLGIPAARLRLLPNVVDAALFRPASREGRAGVTLLAAGRFTSEKRFDRFLSLLARVRADSREPVRGVLVGDGPERGRLERLAGELGLSREAVEFRGETRDIAAAYREADLLLLTSEYEGAPNVVLEAMAAGLPVVATDVGDVGRMIEDGATGFLTKPYDEAQMSAMIRRLTSDRGLRTAFGNAARRKIETDHSLECLPRFLSNLYKETFV
ncbi:MAG: glycosyltransferase [Blastocatellia bacterium]|nr:glycosyltransferase [Blastocatellia bacterium]